MKKILIFLLLFGILGACKKNEPIIEPIKQLPAATQRGANTAGCLLNGEAIFPKGSVYSLHFFYNDGLHLGLGISHEKNNVDRRSIGLATNERLHVGKTYILSEYGGETNYGEISLNGYSPPNPNYFVTNSLITGELTITAHNFDQAYLSGTFWFDAVNSEGEIMKVREGRFDMQY